MEFTAHVSVLLKPDVMDPQGQAVEAGLQGIGHTTLRRVRVGRYFEVTVEADSADAAKQDVARMCDELLANPITERYTIRIQEAAQ